MESLDCSMLTTQRPSSEDTITSDGDKNVKLKWLFTPATPISNLIRISWFSFLGMRFYCDDIQSQDEDVHTCVTSLWIMDLNCYNLKFRFFYLYFLLATEICVCVFAWDTNSFQFLVVDFNQAYVRMCQVKRRHFFYSRIFLYFPPTLAFWAKIKIEIMTLAVHIKMHENTFNLNEVFIEPCRGVNFTAVNSIIQ